MDSEARYCGPAEQGASVRKGHLVKEIEKIGTYGMRNYESKSICEKCGMTILTYFTGSNQIKVYMMGDKTLYRSVNGE